MNAFCSFPISEITRTSAFLNAQVKHDLRTHDDSLANHRPSPTANDSDVGDFRRDKEKRA